MNIHVNMRELNQYILGSESYTILINYISSTTTYAHVYDFGIWLTRSYATDDYGTGSYSSYERTGESSEFDIVLRGLIKLYLCLSRAIVVSDLYVYYYS